MKESFSPLVFHDLEEERGGEGNGVRVGGEGRLRAEEPHPWATLPRPRTDTETQGGQGQVTRTGTGSANRDICLSSDNVSLGFGGQSVRRGGEKGTGVFRGEMSVEGSQEG